MYKKVYIVYGNSTIRSDYGDSDRNFKENIVMNRDSISEDSDTIIVSISDVFLTPMFLKVLK